MAQRPSRPGLDRPDRPAQRGRDLGLGESASVRQHDDPTLQRIQRAERVLDRRSSLLPDQRHLRTRLWPGRRHGLAGGRKPLDGGGVHLIAASERGEGRGAVTAACSPEVIDGPVVGDRHQPWAQRAARRVEELGPVPQCEERLLGHLGGDPPISDSSALPPRTPPGRADHRGVRGRPRIPPPASGPGAPLGRDHSPTQGADRAG